MYQVSSEMSRPLPRRYALLTTWMSSSTGPGTCQTLKVALLASMLVGFTPGAQKPPKHQDPSMEYSIYDIEYMVCSINIRILKTVISGILLEAECRMLMFMRSFGALHKARELLPSVLFKWRG